MEQLVLQVRNKGKIISTYDSAKYRQDECGAWMSFSEYGNRNSTYWREIDHIVSQDHWWSDSLSNLRPLQWENNASKSNGRLVCKVSSNGNQNFYMK